MPTSPQSKSPSDKPWTESAVVLCLCVGATAGYAMYAGQDRNWDLLNYHLYTVHAWLTDRMFQDLAPAQIQTWINPAVLLPQYLLIQHAPPIVAGALMGAIAGINGPLLWVIVRRLQDRDSSRLSLASASLVVITGLSGSIFMGFIGTTFPEYLCAPFVLASVACLVADNQSDLGASRFVFAGFFLGIATGLKLTYLIYALGMFAALLVLWPALGFGVTSIASFAVGGIAGFVLAAGYWSVKLWYAFRSPMFPYFNGLFKSPWTGPTNFVDPRFVPPSFVNALVSYPFAWLLGIWQPTNESFFREPRFAFAAALLPMALIVTVLRTLNGPPDRHRSDGAAVRNFWFVAFFFLFSFGIWLKQFGVQRYALPLELLTGVIALLSLESVLGRSRETVAVLSTLVLFALAWTRPPDFDRMPYGHRWFGVEAPQRTGSPTLYIMMSWRPMSYTIPFLPKEDRFIRLGGNMPLEPEMLLGQRALEIIRTHRGPIKTMTLERIEEPERARLSRFGLVVTDDSCSTFRSRLDNFLTCPVTRVQAPVEPRAATR
jgi:MFS family permease